MPLSPLGDFEPDDAQRQVVEHAAGALLVTGPAGTGKTAALRERFARLIEGGADPERVALVVRSQRDRDEARTTLLERLRRPLPSLRVSTVHGLAFQVVALRFAELGYGEPPRILSANDQFAKVQELLDGEDPEEWPAYGRLLGMRGFADEVRQFLNRAQEALLSPDDIESKAVSAGLAGWRELASFYRRYIDVLGGLDAVDFAGLVEQAARAAQLGEPLLDHLLVDDYQDTTFGAEALALGLRARCLVVAGDEASHVFSFQGTTVEPMSRFAERVPSLRTIELSERHRGAEVTAEAWRSKHISEEHAAVARELRRIHVEDGVAWSELAVLVRRQSAHLAGLLRALDDAGVPRHVPEGGLSPAAESATWPYILALQWVARPDLRDELVDPVLTSELGGISPASARGLLRTARTQGKPPASALEATESLTPAEADSLARLRETLEGAERVRASALDAFGVLWRELGCSARLVSAAEGSPQARASLDAVVALSQIIARAGESADASVEAFLTELEAGGGGPGLAVAGERGLDAVAVLTAHGAAGREFDTVLVTGVVEGDFPSLTRPEPMFDLGALERTISRSERNRLRVADERRLFAMVISRARRRALLTASDPHGEDQADQRHSRFAEELGVDWQAARSGPFEDPVSVAEAAAAWRRGLADPQRPASQRLAALDGLLTLGIEPSRWWFQRGWTDTGTPLHEKLSLSFSRLDKLENCELQFVLGEELGLSRRGGYQAGVGKIVHEIIERCENGEIERSPEALEAALLERWDPSAFPSLAISDAFKQFAIERMLPNWWKYFGELPATASEVGFRFEFDDAGINGVIDRIGPHEGGGSRITDFKTGNPDKAPKAKDSLQLGIYYLAVLLDDRLADYRPVRSVDLAYIRGHWKTPHDMVSQAWPVSTAGEQEFQTEVRQRLSGLIERIHDLDASETYRANPKADCYFCDFKTLCSLYPQGRPLFDIVGSS